MRGGVARWRRALADACYVGLSLSLWFGGTVLIGLGLLTAATLLATGGGLFFFAHLENLSRHYLAADPETRAIFDRDGLGVMASLVTLVGLVRLPSFVDRMRAVLREDPSRD